MGTWGGKLISELEADPELYRLYTDVEMPLVSVLAEMEREGIEVDLPKIRRAWPRIEAACMTLCEEVGKAYGQALNPFSATQIRDFLQKTCRLRLKNTDSVDDDLLKGLSARHVLIRKLLVLDLKLNGQKFPDYLGHRGGPNRGRFLGGFSSQHITC